MGKENLKHTVEFNTKDHKLMSSIKLSDINYFNILIDLGFNKIDANKCVKNNPFTLSKDGFYRNY